MTSTGIKDYLSLWGSAIELAEAATHCARSLGIDAGKINQRLIRYYAGEGVISKPDRLGREAAYNYRHLLELLVARRLAQSGSPLAVIKTFTGEASVAELEAALTGSVEEKVMAATRKTGADWSQIPRQRTDNALAVNETMVELRKTLADYSEQMEKYESTNREQFYRIEHGLEIHRETTLRLAVETERWVQTIRSEIQELSTLVALVSKQMDQGITLLAAQSQQKAR
jgi:DNA-binding transcriptional MerR regulator